MNNSSNLLIATLGTDFQLERYFALIQTQAFENEIKKDLELISNWQDADRFFEGHARFILSLNLYNQQGIGIEMWFNLLNRIYEISPQAYDRIHKGTAYYHAGIMSLLNYNYIEGFEWLDYAFEQDIPTERVGNEGCPAIWTLSFDPRLNKDTRPNDFGVTLSIRNKVNELLKKINSLESSFTLEESDLRNKINMSFLNTTSNRVIRASWVAFIGNIMNKERTIRYLNIAPKSGEIQLLAHKTLVDLTLILESLLKKSNCASSCGVIPTDTLGNLINKIVPNKYSAINLTHGKLITTTIHQNYSQIIEDINTAEAVPENKLAIAFTLSNKVRNHSHHLFNMEYISKEVLDSLFIRISYAILSVIVNLY